MAGPETAAQFDSLEALIAVSLQVVTATEKQMEHVARRIISAMVISHRRRGPLGAEKEERQIVSTLALPQLYRWLGAG